ncbi:MAG: 3-deoxy-D-manno-octulosonic acid transferase [Chlamydiales bacterium]|nr:3-deoxy-D-manno-octulosonic acid transferase [Chlamydiales bacterium]MCH9620101.1 3-deoxy-D-manno-octulosonic acid transferase [Chlamydiales bacterium]MCH9623571.1 3-deoxy-D-manno-octulosonic acid transferase [Chlamydiales bacterium]
MRFLYTCALHLYALAFFPKVVRKYGRDFLCRLGYGFPKIEKDEKPICWIHAVSLGETKTVAPLIDKLKEDYRILLSTVTLTGRAEGLRSCAANWFAYLPFDLPYLIKPIVKRVHPKLLILVETDFWFHFEDAVKQGGGKIIVVNGKVSKRSFERLSKFPKLAKLLLDPIDRFCVQGKLYEERFLKLGIPREKLLVTGNLKLDATLKGERIESEETILTLGSTHDPEEALWLPILSGFPSLKTYIAPRHPERFDTIANLLTARGVKFGRLSKGDDFSSCSIILVDQMGALKKCYKRSTLAFVGGSLTAGVGGHNILEPCLYGVPVLFGPHMEGQPDMLDLVQRYHAGVEINSTTMEKTLTHLLNSIEERNLLSDGGKKLIAEESKAFIKTVDAISCMK